LASQCLLASYIPARRAASVNPVDALRGVAGRRFLDGIYRNGGQKR
jgi:hypothetical protein